VIKTIPPVVFDEPAAFLVKRARAWRGSNDRNAFIKRAGYSFLDVVDSLSPGELGVHLTAMGACEVYNSNRNGDGFYEPVLRVRHVTFPKHAMFFRNHKNRDKAISYGRVVKSAYYDPMHRVELFVGLNGTKEAAIKNGGYLADLELDALESNRDIAVSMACLVSHDICSGCNHAARSPEEYCTAVTCKRGGLSERMGLLCDDGHILHAINPDPVFFDISHITNGRAADRIAYVMGQVGYAKTANYGQVDDASGLYLPDWCLTKSAATQAVADRIKAASVLADVEPNSLLFTLAWHRDVTGDAPTLPRSAGERNDAYKAVINAKIAMTVADWLYLETGNRADADTVAPAVVDRLGGVFGRLLTSENCDAYCDAVPSGTASPQKQAWAANLAESRGATPAHADRRSKIAAIRNYDLVSLPQCAAVTPDTSEIAEDLALRYAAYKAAALATVPVNHPDFRMTAALLAAHNVVA